MDDDNQGLRELVGWLERSGPDEWHRTALTFNWDAGLKVLEWIVSQPDCDRGTAIAVEAIPGWASETVGLLRLICERWAAGAYQNYRFSPIFADHVQSFAIDGSRIPWTVPADLAQPEIKGERLDTSGYCEGYSPALIEDLDVRGIPF